MQANGTPRSGLDRGDAFGARVSGRFCHKYLDYGCRRWCDTGRIVPLFAQQSSKRQQLRDYAPHQGCMGARQVDYPANWSSERLARPFLGRGP